MEQADLTLIERYQEQDSELRSLWEQHQEYERILQKYEGRPYLSPTQTQEIKQLKKKKLAGKTKLQQVLEQYRQPEG
ncbi:MAG: DUF465 domain-containing protein [Desulfovibrio sp.]|jgi:uncharacterized protein YdcH (DUF465 family)|nr:DUF465 domain-containing protein [Desulfovibrio sp.]